MRFSTFRHDKYVVLQIQEEKLNSIIAPQLKSDLVVFNVEGVRNLLLDMSQIQYADSSGLSALLRARSLFTGAGGVFVLFGLTPHVLKLIQISQLDSVLDILPSRQEAIERVFMHEIEFGIEEEEEEESGE